MQNIINCGIYFANVPLMKTNNETRCENINCTYQYCIGCKLETVIIWTQTPDKKCLIVPIIKNSIEQHEQKMGSLGDNLAIIKLKAANNNSILSFCKGDISYADVNRATWIKSFRIIDEYLIDGEIRVLNETEIYDLSFRVKALPVLSVNTISNININKNLNLNSKIISYNDTSLKE